ncbi:hypothetical protein ACFQ3N_17410 [Virgibacillus byunsanensis]|uniref:Uncharacterized protein n=1 Tax=Virgibacillus byunsanensis TaxID=570945 RepID=A0ABW3LQT2_9BACI
MEGHQNDLASFITFPITYVILFSLLNLLNLDFLFISIFLFIHFLVITGVAFKVMGTTIRKLLGSKNKPIQNGYFYIMIIVSAGIAVFLL